MVLYFICYTLKFSLKNKIKFSLIQVYLIVLILPLYSFL